MEVGETIKYKGSKWRMTRSKDQGHAGVYAFYREDEFVFSSMTKGGGYRLMKQYENKAARPSVSPASQVRTLTSEGGADRSRRKAR